MSMAQWLQRPLAGLLAGSIGWLCLSAPSGVPSAYAQPGDEPAAEPPEPTEPEPTEPQPTDPEPPSPEPGDTSPIGEPQTPEPAVEPSPPSPRPSPQSEGGSGEGAAQSGGQQAGKGSGAGSGNKGKDGDKDKGGDKEKSGDTGDTGDKPKEHEGRFAFGTYGRVIAAGDLRGRPGRNTDITAFGSRLDHQSYVELELRREDYWPEVDTDTKIVGTLAVAHPVFHYNGEFDARIAVRNLFIEEKNLGTKGLRIWAGSRMLRGDDIYLLDFWPLDNLNTIGGGAFYDLPTKTQLSIHMGRSQPQNPFYRQQGERPVPLNQFGAATVDILDRQRWIGSARAQQIIPIGEKAGIKLVAYTEIHQVPGGQRETAEAGIYEDVPKESGYVVGGQVVGYTGEHDTHINLYARYARGTAAYGAFAHPEGLGQDGSVNDAHEFLVAAGGNAEFGPVAVLLGAYFRSFRNASAPLDFGDVDEGIVIVRPQVWFVDWLGLGVEGSYQGQQRGVVTTETNEPGDDVPRPLVSRIARVGVMPFITPAGRGSYKRPNFYFIYTASFRDAGARALYPTDDVFSTRSVEHFAGFGAEWWFGSTSYAR